MNSRGLVRRLVAGAVALAVSSGAAVVTTVAATAAVGDGTLTVLPATGTDQTVPTGTTSGPCPTTANGYNIQVQGPINGTITGTNASGFSTTSAFTADFGQSFATFASLTSQTIVAGTYAVNLRCVNTFGQVSATFAGSVTFTDATHYQTNATATGTPTPAATPTPMETPTPAATPTPMETPTPTHGAITTMTRLSVIRIPLPFRLGGFVIPIANVNPFFAGGTVQFKDSATNLGSPVPVAGLVAIGPFIILHPGPHSVTAVFTPTNPANFKPSTSNTVNLIF